MIEQEKEAVNMKKWQALTLTVSLIVWLACNNLWIYTDYPIYYFGIAQIIFVASLLIYTQPNKTKYQNFISSIFLFISANNLLDELFFDPQAFELNEYISFVAFTIYSLWKHYKR